MSFKLWLNSLTFCDDITDRYPKLPDLRGPVFKDGNGP